jgi:hypothetical protein
MPVKPIFLEVASLNPQIYGIGRTKTRMSVNMFKAPAATNAAFRIPQCPGIVMSQFAANGRQRRNASMMILKAQPSKWT